MASVSRIRRLSRGGLGVLTATATSGSRLGMLVMEDYLWESAFNYVRNMTYVIFGRD
ncbi:hypothetical protein EMIT0P44_190074 [Pseudomonas sp. IT-P44]